MKSLTEHFRQADHPEQFFKHASGTSQCASRSHYTQQHVSHKTRSSLVIASPEACHEKLLSEIEQLRKESCRVPIDFADENNKHAHAPTILIQYGCRVTVRAQGICSVLDSLIHKSLFSYLHQLTYCNSMALATIGNLCNWQAILQYYMNRR